GTGGSELRSGITGQRLPVPESLFRPAAPGLRRVGIRHGAGEIALGDTTWRADDVDVELRRERDGIGVRGHLALDIGAERVPVRLDGRYRAAAVRLAIGFRGLSPPAVAAALPRLGSIAALVLPLGGVVDLRMDDALRLHGARLRLASAGGRLALVPGSPLPVGRTAVAAVLDRDTGRLEVGRLAVELDGARAEVRGALAGLEGAGSFEADGQLGGLPVARLASCWPEGLAPGARRVAVDARLRGGVADALAALEGISLLAGIEPSRVRGEVDARVVADVPLGGPPPDLAALGLQVTASFHGLGVPRVVRGWSLTDGELSLALAGRRLALAGNANVEGVPVELDLTEMLGGRASRALVVGSRLD